MLHFHEKYFDPFYYSMLSIGSWLCDRYPRGDNGSACNVIVKIWVLHGENKKLSMSSSNSKMKRKRGNLLWCKRKNSNVSQRVVQSSVTFWQKWQLQQKRIIAIYQYVCYTVYNMKYILSSYRAVWEPATCLHYKCHLSKELTHRNLRCIVNSSALTVLNKDPRRAVSANQVGLAWVGKEVQQENAEARQH